MVIEALSDPCIKKQNKKKGSSHLKHLAKFGFFRGPLFFMFLVTVNKKKNVFIASSLTGFSIRAMFQEHCCPWKSKELLDLISLAAEHP